MWTNWARRAHEPSSAAQMNVEMAVGTQSLLLIRTSYQGQKVLILNQNLKAEAGVFQSCSVSLGVRGQKKEFKKAKQNQKSSEFLLKLLSGHSQRGGIVSIPPPPRPISR